MRITNQMKQGQLLLDLSRLQNDLFISQRVLSTGREVEKPSDDTAAARRIMLLRSTGMRRDQYARNIDDGIARLSYAETQLTTADDLLKEARTLVLQATNGATTDADRSSIATRIEQMLHEMISIANARHEDQYLFGGFNTQDAPYTPITDPLTGDIIQVRDQLNGMDGKIYRMTADGEKVQVNVLGLEVFQTGEPGEDGDLFQTLIDLRAALLDGIENDRDQEPPASPPVPGDPVYTRPQYDSAVVLAETLNKIDVASERIRVKLTEIGSAVRRLMKSEERHQDLKILEDQHLSSTIDADLTEWISKYQMQSLALQQAVSVGGQVLQSGLVSFIR